MNNVGMKKKRCEACIYMCMNFVSQIFQLFVYADYIMPHIKNVLIKLTMECREKLPVTSKLQLMALFTSCPSLA